jgi:hypothetical protein
VVTVHGIGFQQPPNDKLGVPGYADALHAALRTPLGERLGDDPDRPHGGPVYVCSEWEGSPDKGLARLDPGKALAQPGRIAHVALVYSPSEPLEPRPGASADALARAALAHGHYSSALGITRMLLADVWATLHERSHGGDGGGAALRPRTDIQLAARHPSRIAAMLHRHDEPAPPAEPGQPGPLGIVRALEDDVATYVARNDLRERVRGFVESCLLALLARDDVDAVVVNAHSQGTVLCWDVLGRLPWRSWRESGDRRASMLGHLVTAGSPIRKYIDMFAWGEQVGELEAVPELPWLNFYDAHDPVADPLDPPASWRPGDSRRSGRPGDPAGGQGLLVAVDPATGARRHVKVADQLVDNIENSAGGGLQAHNYWANEDEVVKRLAGLLSGLHRR